MSHDATNWAIEQRGLSPTAKLVLWRLADSHNPEHGCFVSQEFLADKVEISRSTVNRALDDLVTKQLISRKRRVNKATGKQLSTRYFLACEKGFEPQDVVDRVPNADTAGAGPSGEEVDEQPVENGSNRVSETGGSVSHGSDTQTCKEPITPLPPESVEFETLLVFWGTIDATDATSAANAFGRLSPDDQRKAIELALPFRQGTYQLGRGVSRLSSYIRGKLFLEFENAPPLEGSYFRVSRGMPEFASWRRHYQKRSAVVATGMDRQGYLLVETRWPPDPNSPRPVAEE